MATTYRLTEHHTAGGMSRWLPYLAELQPEMFCEVSPGARARARPRARRLDDGRHRARGDRGARDGHRAHGAADASGGRQVHQVGLPYHWGSRGLVTGDSANDLLGLALDPNVHIGEYKAQTCDVRAGRRPRGAALVALLEGYRRRAAKRASPMPPAKEERP